MLKLEIQKIQYVINKEAAKKKTALSSTKIDRYEYVTSEEILPSNQKQIKQKTKITYSSLGKAL